MKKLRRIFCMLLVILTVLSPIVYVDAKTTKKTTTTTTTTTVKAEKAEPIKIYVFYGETCPHCQDLHEYLDELEEDKTINYMFDVVDYEVWASETNYNLMMQVGEYFETEITGVPFFVIGDTYYSGYGESSQDSITTTIKNAYSNPEYVDVVAGIGTGEITGTISEENDSKNANNQVGIIILGITVVVVIILIVSSGKNKYYDDEEDDEETVAEEVVKETKKVKTEEKANVKKTTTAKKTNNKSTATKSKAKTTKNTKTSKKKKI